MRASSAARSRRSTRRQSLESSRPTPKTEPTSKSAPISHTPKPRSQYDYLFMRVGREVGGIHWLYLKAQGIAESNLDPSAVSRAGAQGLMQFMPRTWMEWGNGSPFDPEESIRAGARYMNWLLNTKTINGDLRKAWAAYNWGIGNLDKAIRAHGDKWERALPRETSEYIARIEHLLEEFNRGEPSS